MKRLAALLLLAIPLTLGCVSATTPFVLTME
jgi:hypothetical protein